MVTLDDLQVMRLNRVPPTTLAVLDQRRVRRPPLVEPPPDQEHVSESLVFPGADHDAVVSAIKVFIVQRAVDQQFDPITHCKLPIAATEHFAGAGLGIATNAVSGPLASTIEAVRLGQRLAEVTETAGPDLVEFPPTGQQVLAIDGQCLKAVDAQFLHAVPGIDAAVAQERRVTPRNLAGIVVVTESFPRHGQAIPSTGIGAENHAASPAKQFGTPMILDRSGSSGVVHEQGHSITSAELAFALAEFLARDGTHPAVDLFACRIFTEPVSLAVGLGLDGTFITGAAGPGQLGLEIRRVPHVRLHVHAGPDGIDDQDEVSNVELAVRIEVGHGRVNATDPSKHELVDVIDIDDAVAVKVRAFDGNSAATGPVITGRAISEVLASEPIAFRLEDPLARAIDAAGTSNGCPAGLKVVALDPPTLCIRINAATLTEVVEIKIAVVPIEETDLDPSVEIGVAAEHLPIGACGQVGGPIGVVHRGVDDLTSLVLVVTRTELLLGSGIQARGHAGGDQHAREGPC